MEIIVQPVILSGGSGKRLWPYSREAFPKQFLPLFGEETLLQQTALRMETLGLEQTSIEKFPPIVVCNESHRFLVAEQLRQIAEQLRQINQHDATIILEPFGRNTAPALTLAAYMANKEGDDPVLIVMPSDHIIRNERAFGRNLTVAAELAQKGHLITFGILPDKPETGFGYIKKGSSIDDNGFILNAFVEKPDAETAKVYFDSGDYLWNSGIFVMRASVWLEEVKCHCPDIAEACKLAVTGGSFDGDFFRVKQEEFEKSPSDSIDYAVMEKISGDSKQIKTVVLPLDAGWSDLGSWSALVEIHDQDTEGNVVSGDVFTKDTKNSVIFAENRFLATIGAENLIIIETLDAVLIAHKNHAQDINKITEYLKLCGRSEHIYHQKVHRPWGNYEPIDDGARYQVKRLTVNPGASLSLQKHNHRAEHWIVVSGTARITRDDKTFLLNENESTYIPVGTLHRLENPGEVDLEIIEVQSGGYLGEDDIVRYLDRYHRIED